MPQRIIAIGDIHGCDQAFEALLQAIGPGSDDVIVPLGDYIDRGPDSRTVIERMIKLSDECQLVPLIGNHEIMFLASREDESQRDFWLHFGGRETLESYGNELDAIPDDHVEFMVKCRSFHETEEHIFLHANYVPTVPLEKQPEYVLFWEHLDVHAPAPHVSGKTAIVGHTPQESGEILDLGHLLCIDTFCFGGQWLTALDVTTGEVWQANYMGQLRTGN